MAPESQNPSNPSSTPNQTAARVPSGQTVAVPRPAAGAAATVDSSPAGNLNLGFDPAEATATRSGNSLVFTLNDGSSVTINNFFVVGNEALPNLTLPDGTTVASADFFSGSGLDMTTAAGPGAGAGGAGSGSGDYRDDAGNLIDGVGKSGSLGTDYWGRGTEVPETQKGELPGGTVSIGLITETPPTEDEEGRVSGTFINQLFEDNRPNQHLDGTDPSGADRSPGELLIRFELTGTTQVDSMTLRGFAAGTVIEFEGGRTVTVTDPSMPVVLTPAELAARIFVLAPEDNTDGDMNITYLVNWSTAGGATGSASGAFAIVVDAVADKPFGESGLEGDAQAYTKAGELAGGIDEGGSLVLRGGEQESVTLKVQAHFTDTDGSEAHHIVITGVPAGWTMDASAGGLNGFAQVGSAEESTPGTYWVDADGAYHFTLDSALADLNDALVFKTGDWTNDGAPIDITIAARTEEVNPTGDEVTTINNESETVLGKYSIEILEDKPEFSTTPPNPLLVLSDETSGTQTSQEVDGLAGLSDTARALLATVDGLGERTPISVASNAISYNLYSDGSDDIALADPSKLSLGFESLAGTFDWKTTDGKAITLSFEDGMVIGKTPEGVIAFVVGAADDSGALEGGVNAGSVFFVQYLSLQHPLHAPDAATRTLGTDEKLLNDLKLNLVLTDDDGDSTSMVVAFNVRDDAPRIELSGEKLEKGSVTVDESLAKLGGAHPDGVESAVLTTTLSGKAVADLFKVDYGADGKGVNDVYSLKLDDSAGPVKSGLFTVQFDAADHKGAEITLSQNGNVVTGSAGGKDYFTLTIDPATGETKLTLLDNIWHGDKTDHDDSVSLELAEGALKLLRTVTDGDGDKAVAGFDLGASGVFKFEDDGPIAKLLPTTRPVAVDETNLPGGTLSATGRFNVNFGADEAGKLEFTGLPAGLLSGGKTVIYAQDNSDPLHPKVVAYTTDITKPVFTLELAGPDAQGNYTYTYKQEQPLDHPVKGDTPAAHNDTLDIKFGIQATDGDGDTAVVNTKVTVYDDGPRIELSGEKLEKGSVTVDESLAKLGGAHTDGVESDTLTTTLSGKAVADLFKVDYGADKQGVDDVYSLKLDDSAGAVASGLFTVQFDAADHKGAEIMLTQIGNVVTGSAGGKDYFTLTIDPDTGAVTLKLLDNIWHGDKTDHDDSVSLELAEGVLKLLRTVTDGDGDKAVAGFDLGASGVFSFEDDGPKIETKATLPDTFKLLVDESHVDLGGVRGDGLLTATLSAKDVQAQFNFDAARDYGADGKGAADAYSLKLTDASGNTDVKVGSGLYTVDPAEADGKGSEIVLSQNGNVITGSAGGKDYFTLTIDPATGETKLTLLDNIWHDKPGAVTALTPNDGASAADETMKMVLDPAKGVLQLVKTVTDGDGDTASAAIDLGKSGVLQFQDDAPEVSLGAPGVTHTLTVVNHGETAATYKSCFGYYIKDAEGNPVDGKIIWANTKATEGQPAGTFELQGYTEDQVGFFLIPDGFSKNSNITDMSEVVFKQDGSGHWQAFLKNGGAALTGSGGSNLLLDNAALNVGGKEHVEDNAKPGNLNWEDVANSSSDNDYDDVNIGVKWTVNFPEPLTTQDAETDGDPTESDSYGPVDFGKWFDVVNADSNPGADGYGGGTTGPVMNYELTLNGKGVDSGLTSGGNAILLVQPQGGDIVGQITVNGATIDVFKISIDADGKVTLTQFEAVDHPGESADGNAFNNSANHVQLKDGLITFTATATVTDGDGDTASDSRHFDVSGAFGFDDDVPVVDLGAAVTADSGARSATFDIIEMLTGADGFGGLQVQVGSDTYTVNKAQFDAGSATFTKAGADGYTLVLDLANGKGTYTLTNALADNGKLERTISMTLTDSDGDKSTDSVKLSFTNKGVSIDNKASGANINVVVDERYLDQAGTDKDGTSAHETGAQANLTKTGSFTVQTPDGMGSLKVGDVALTNPDGSLKTASASNPIEVDNAQYGKMYITGISGNDTAGYTVTYSYTLTKNYGDHTTDASGDPGRDIKDNAETFTVSVTDKDGSAATGTFTVDIKDDVPLVQLGADVAPAGGVRAATFDITEMLSGADGFGGLQVKVGSDTYTVNKEQFEAGSATFTKAGADGYTLVLDLANGKGTYTLTNALADNGKLERTISMTLTDGDGDTATDSVKLSFSNKGVSIDNKASGANINVVVDERYLDQAGTDKDGTSAHESGAQANLTKTGSFTVQTPDGMGSLKVGDVALTNPDGSLKTASASNPIEVDNAQYGKMYITGISGNDTAGYTVTYSYTLTKNYGDHTTDASGDPGRDIKDNAETFTVSVTDKDGSAAIGTFTVDIRDDVPLVQLGADVAPAGGVRAATFDITEMLSGADGFGGLQVKVGSDTYTVNKEQFDAGSATFTKAGADGYTLALDLANGKATYTLANALANGTSLERTVSMTLTDGDGDTATDSVKLSFSNKGVLINNQASGANINVVVDERYLDQAGTDKDGTSAHETGAQANLTKTGSFTVQTPDGMGSLKVGDVALTNPDGSLKTASVTNPIEVDNAQYGKMYITGISGNDTAGYTVTYSYTLTKNYGDHTTDASGDLGRDIKDNAETFTISVTDKDGSAATGTFTVDITDDAPLLEFNTANGYSDIDSLGTINYGASASLGNLEFKGGADGIASVMVKLDNGAAVAAKETAAGSGIWEATLANGSKLTINSVTHETTFSSGTLAAGGHNINVIVTDRDGDTAADNLSMTIRDPLDVKITATDSVVHEAALPKGTGEDWTGETGGPVDATATGTFIITGTPTGVSISLGGMATGLALPGAVGGTASTVVSGDTLSITNNGGGNYSYTYTLGQAKTHGTVNDSGVNERVDVGLKIDVTGPSGSKSATTTISVVDDEIVGKATDIHINEPTPTNYCLTLVVDVSTSMNETVSGTGGKTRLQITEDALVDMLTAYKNSSNGGDFAISLVTYAGDVRVNKTYNNIDEAIHDIKADIYTGSANGTNYAVGLNAALPRVNTNLADHPDYLQKVYFFSDGEPNGGSVNGSYVPAAWTTMITDSVKGPAVDVYSIGIGITATSGSAYTEMNKIVNTEMGDTFIGQGNIAELSKVLTGTVPSVADNLLDHILGADRPLVLESLTVKGVTTNLAASGETKIDFGQGVFLYVKATGEYRFEATKGVDRDITFDDVRFNIKDADGDRASVPVNLTVHDLNPSAFDNVSTAVWTKVTEVVTPAHTATAALDACNFDNLANSGWAVKAGNASTTVLLKQGRLVNWTGNNNLDSSDEQGFTMTAKGGALSDLRGLLNVSSDSDVSKYILDTLKIAINSNSGNGNSNNQFQDCSVVSKTFDLDKGETFRFNWQFQNGSNDQDAAFYIIKNAAGQIVACGKLAQGGTSVAQGVIPGYAAATAGEYTLSLVVLDLGKNNRGESKLFIDDIVKSYEVPAITQDHFQVAGNLRTDASPEGMVDNWLSTAALNDRAVLDSITYGSSVHAFNGAASITVPTDDGILTVKNDGSYTFDAKPGLELADISTDFSYTIKSADNDTDTAHLYVRGSQIAGTDGHDVINGTVHDDYIQGGAGNDTIHGGDGNDAIAGGAGDDVIHGDAGHDVIYGGTGNDLIYGGAGHDTIFGGAGNDLIYGGAGNDVMYGGDGNDTFAWAKGDIDAGAVDKIMDFSLGNDKLSFADLFGDAQPTVGSITTLLESHDLSLKATDSTHLQLSVTHAGATQTVDITLSTGLSAQNMSLANSDDSAEQAQLLQQMLTNVGG